jgi:hypothetical protein
MPSPCTGASKLQRCHTTSIIPGPRGCHLPHAHATHSANCSCAPNTQSAHRLRTSCTPLQHGPYICIQKIPGFATASQSTTCAAQMVPLRTVTRGTPCVRVLQLQHRCCSIHAAGPPPLDPQALSRPTSTQTSNPHAATHNPFSPQPTTQSLVPTLPTAPFLQAPHAMLSHVCPHAHTRSPTHGVGKHSRQAAIVWSGQETEGMYMFSPPVHG